MILIRNFICIDMLCVNTRSCHQNVSSSRYNDITRSHIDRMMHESNNLLFSLEELKPRDVDCSFYNPFSVCLGSREEQHKHRGGDSYSNPPFSGSMLNFRGSTPNIFLPKAGQSSQPFHQPLCAAAHHLSEIPKTPRTAIGILQLEIWIG